MTKTSLTNESIILTISRSISVGLGFLPLALLSRMLSYQDYGSYRQVLLIIGFLLPLVSIGIPGSINIFIPQLIKTKQKTFIYQTYIVLLIIGAVLSLIIYFASEYISIFFNNNQLSLYLKIFALYPLFYLPSHFYSYFFTAIKKIKLVSILTIVLGSIHTLAIVIPIVLGLELTWLFRSLVVYSFIQFTIVSMYIYRIYSKEHLIFDIKLFVKQIRFSIPLGMGAIIGIMNIRIDQIMVSYFFTPEEYAIFANGAIEIPFMGVLLSSVMAVTIPYFVMHFKEGNIIDFLKLWHQSITKISLIVIPAIILLMIYSREFILILFAEKYLPSIPIFMAYLFTLFSRVTLYGGILRTINKPQFILYSASFGVIINIILNVILIHAVGLIGAAIATVIGQYVINLIQLYFIKRHLKIGFKKVFPWKSYIQILLVSTSIGFVPYGVKLLIMDDIVRIVLGSSLYLIILLIILYHSNIVNSKELINQLLFNIKKWLLMKNE